MSGVRQGRIGLIEGICDSSDVLVLFAFIAGFAVLLVGTVVFFLRERR